MSDQLRLDSFLDHNAHWNPALVSTCRVVEAFANVGRKLARILARGHLAGNLGRIVAASLDGDGQKALDALAHDIIRDELRQAMAGVFASEEALAPELLNADGDVAVAVDPLDGSSNVNTLVPIGTIFSILPRRSAGDAEQAFLQPGRHQLAAGFLIYGPHTSLVLTLGTGAYIFTLEPDSGAYLSTGGPVAVPTSTREYAINGSNLRHWEPAIRDYILELKKGAEGPRGADFNTRWLASMVGEAYRILSRGGIYLYPADERPGYEAGRLRLVYEGNPIALIMEQAGGVATDGRSAILDLQPATLHQRCPLIFGSADEVRRVIAACGNAAPPRPPLFRHRSLFQSPPNAFEPIS